MRNDSESKKRLFVAVTTLFVIALCIYTFIYRETYNSIKIDTVKIPTVEYGSPNYDLNKLINNVDGKIISVKKDIETNEVGKQELILVVSKGNISKEIPVSVEIKDSVAPKIVIKEETVVVDQGDSIDLVDNVSEVYDDIDGDISFVESSNVTEELVDYYTVYSDYNYNVPGTYEVIVDAVDKNGNSSSLSYNIVVNERSVGYNATNIAYSLLGKAYAYGGTGPDAFDCSGFVQYVYRRLGYSISRSSSTQLYDGVAVSYSNALPGDILNFGYSDGTSTHSALYVGNGKMIHAANQSLGVVLSDVDSWISGSGTVIIGVRRIK